MMKQAERIKKIKKCDRDKIKDLFLFFGKLSQAQRSSRIDVLERLINL